MMDSDQHPLARSFEPLSQREREILVLLAENLSNREIADRLVLALTTVKWYNSQIFGKLAVENRKQAVERAMSLGLLYSPGPIGTSLHNLPPQLTPFIGRVGELDELENLLNHPNTRLVTILAPGGMGKTRLALAAAEAALQQFADGVYFVSLAPLTSLKHLIPAIAEVLSLQFFPDNRTPEQQLLDFLRTKQTLLVLDNFEHLLEGAPLVTDLLQAAPQLKVLITSRQRLQLDGETIYRLGGLSYPEQSSSVEMLDTGAVQLFLECAHRAYPHFSHHDEESVVRVCQLVQGMPLAIELAAAWVGTLRPSEIADEIANSADFLHTTMRNAPERLRSIRAVFEATWRRMTADEQQAFRRLSVFRGGCTREAAGMVAGAELVTLATLIDKALLWHHPEKGRYEIHELLRQYAAEQLDAAGEAETIRAAHRVYFGKLAQTWGKALKTPKQLHALDILEADFDNLRQAFQRAIETGNSEAIEPFTDLWHFYEIRARNVEGSATFAAAIEVLKGRDSLALGKLLVGQAIFHERFRQFDQERRLAQESLDMLRRLGAERESLFSMTALGVGMNGSGDVDAAALLWRETLVIAERYDDQWVAAILLVCLAGEALAYRRFDDAKQMYSQAYALMTKLGNYWGRGFILIELAYMALRDGDYGEAQRCFESGLASAQSVHHLNNVSSALNGLRQVAITTGDLLQARRHTDRMLGINRDSGDRHGIFQGIIGLAEIAIASGDFPEARKLLREALTMFSELSDPACILNIGMAAIPFLSQTAAAAQAVLVLSFLQRSPIWKLLLTFEHDRLQSQRSQLQSNVPSDTYSAAWNAGQSITVDALLIILHRVI